MRIAIISPFHSMGGGERYALSLAKAMSQTNHSVTLFINSPKKNNCVYLKNLKVQYIKSNIFPIDPGNPISTALVKYLLTENFDIIHIHQMYSFFNILSSICGKMKRVPTVLTDHGGGWRLAATPHICANFPDSLAAVSSFSLEKILRFAPQKRNNSRVVYGGVNTEVFYPKKSDLRQRLRIEDKSIILCLGRVLPHKGLEVVIKALPYLPANTKLLIVGQIYDFKYFNYLKMLASKNDLDKVIFIGQVPEQALSDYYNICDIFIQPSLYFDYTGRYHKLSELLGLSKLEAMACGRPVIVSNVGGLPEKIVRGKNGYVFEPADVKGLVRQITELQSDYKLRKKIGANALTTIQNELTWDRVARDIIDFYESKLN